MDRDRWREAMENGRVVIEKSLPLSDITINREGKKMLSNGAKIGVHALTDPDAPVIKINYGSARCLIEVWMEWRSSGHRSNAYTFFLAFGCFLAIL